jgi:hypothetical protein
MKLGWIVTAVFLGGVLCSSHMHAPRRTVFLFDPLLSDLQHASLATDFAVAKFSANNFPAVQQVTTRALPLRCAEVLVTAYRPLALVNEQLVLAQSGVFLPRHGYREDKLVDVPALKVSQAVEYARAPDALVTFVPLLHAELLSKYEVNWKQESLVEWQDRQQPELLLISCSNKVPTVTQQQRSHAIADIVGRAKNITFDVRFDRQMVVAVGATKKLMGNSGLEGLGK